MVRRWRWRRLLSRIVVVLRVESGVHNAARRLPCGLCLRARLSLSLSLSLTEPKPGLRPYVVGHGDLDGDAEGSRSSQQHRHC